MLKLGSELKHFIKKKIYIHEVTHKKWNCKDNLNLLKCVLNGLYHDFVPSLKLQRIMNIRKQTVPNIRLCSFIHCSRAAVVHLNFRAGSTFPVSVCTVPSSMDRTSRCNMVDAVRLYASYRLNLLLLAGAEVRV